MTEVPLPPLPLIPASNTERIAWVRWATEAVLAERDRIARQAEELAVDYCDGNFTDFAAAIRKG